MRILVLTLNAWNETNSTGNTLSNLFSGLSDKDEVANIYCRDEPIDNSVCERYYKITEKQILCNLFTPWRCGKVIKREDNNKKLSSKTLARNKAIVSFGRHHTSLLLLRELIWSITIWKNKKLKHYLKDFAPDCIYMHGHYNLYMHKLLSYCEKVTKAKIVLYWGDDMYGCKTNKPLGYVYETMLRRRFALSINSASLLFGGSLKLCAEYSKLFNKRFVPFFKECKHIKYDANKQTGNPITIVYAGNLLFGREKIMVDLVRAIDNINNRGLSHQFKLKVFSNTDPSTDSLIYLDDRKNSWFMGRKPYSEVCGQMDQSDLVLFIESFNKKDILSTRLSFSTKIIDCMQSSAGILAIGPSEIASMDYIEEFKLGYTITSIAEIESKLAYLADHPEVISETNKNKVEFARNNHTNTSEKAITEIRRLF